MKRTFVERETGIPGLERQHIVHSLRPGDQLDDWFVLEILGAGNNGTVASVWNTRDGTTGVLKHAEAEDGSSSAYREGIAYRVLENMSSDTKGFLTLLDVGTDYFVVKERIVSLDHMPLPMSWDAARDMLQDLLSALHKLHATSYVHHGMKPENVAWFPDRYWGLIDLGNKSVPLRGGYALGNILFRGPRVKEKGYFYVDDLEAAVSICIWAVQTRLPWFDLPYRRSRPKPYLEARPGYPDNLPDFLQRYIDKLKSYYSKAVYDKLPDEAYILE